MSMSKMAVKRPVTTFMLVLIVIAFGILSIFNINMDMLPNMNIPVAIVSTTYDGAGPEEIETLITKTIESAVGTVAGVSDITSSSSFGSSIVIVQFENNVNIDNAALDMRERIDMYKRLLPDDASDPMVVKIDVTSMSSIMIGITAEDMDITELKRLVDEKIVNRLERQDGVASVSVSGGRDKEIQVVLNEEKLRGYGISESTVTNILYAENKNTPTGSIKQGDVNLSLRVSGEFETLQDIENLPFTTSGGGVVYLRDFAEVTEVYKDYSSVSYINGTPSVSLTIQKQSTANTVNVSNAIAKELVKIQQDMPTVDVKMLYDPADYINMSLSSVIDSAVQGGILAVIILYIFLRNYRSTFIVAASMPISIIATFVLMYYANITINMMSLGGLTLGVGMLVDNSIVVLESIYRKIEEGQDRVSAAIDGAKEIAMSVIASTLTTVAVFLPISFVGGLVAEIFNQLSLTIAFSLASSLVVSLTFVPMLCSLILKEEHVSENQTRRIGIFEKVLNGFGKGINKIEKFYDKALVYCLSHKKLTVVAVMIFTVLTLMSLGIVGMEFMPSTDEGTVSISISMPKGTILEETEAMAFKVVDRITDQYDEIIDISFSVGGGGISLTGSSSDSASVTVNLVDKEDRNRSSEEIGFDMARKLSDIAGAEIKVDASGSSMGSYGGGGISLMIKGDELDTLTEIANDFVKIIESVEGTTQVESSVQERNKQATIKINRSKATSYGISSSSVATLISTAVQGSAPTTYKIDGTEYDIRIIQNQDNFDYINDIENIIIPSATGIGVPLYEIADITIGDVPATISRDNQERYVTVSSSLEGRDSNSAMRDIEKLLATYPMPDNYTWEVSGSLEQMNEAFSGLGMALIMAVALVYMIMAAEFESLIYPFIVMFSIPIALTGGIFGLFVMGESLSITGFLGMIMLAGIVVNNAIVLIDYTNLLIKERGMGVYEALVTAGPVRLRPILMTTLTTVLGLVPMMLSTSSGSEMMKGLATVVVFGLVLSTFVTLLFIPVIYMGMEMVKAKVKNRMNKTKTA